MDATAAEAPPQTATGEPLIRIEGVSKVYASGFRALDGVDLTIRRGEILGLLGPNGAGKTTLISIVCGIVTRSSGKVTVAGHDIEQEFRKTRAMIGLVPQELTTDAFETVEDTVSFSRGLFGKPPNPRVIERILRDLSLWEKRDQKIMALSGGMKRRLLIAKALAHEPRILFLDEPTAGVDVELRKGMWELVRRLRESGVTIVLTTHYIEEAEQMADRIAVINQGRIVLVEETAGLMRKLGRKELTLELAEPIEAVPADLDEWDLELSEDGCRLQYTYDTQASRTGITRLLSALADSGIRFRDLGTRQSSLEDIFVDLVRER